MKIMPNEEGLLANRAAPNPPDDAASPALGATLLRVAWLAIALGLTMEVLLLLLAAGFAAFPDIGPAIADTVGQVSWSIVVCVGLALGTTVSRARTPLMGLLGVLAAPLALVISRSIHQGTLAALNVAETIGGGPPTILLALIKGIEYGCLGLIIGWVGQRPWGGMAAHLGTGLLVGTVFGGAVLALIYLSAPEALPASTLISRGVNEALFPVGCSLVLFAAAALGERRGR